MNIVYKLSSNELVKLSEVQSETKLGEAEMGLEILKFRQLSISCWNPGVLSAWVSLLKISQTSSNQTKVKDLVHQCY